MYSWRAGEHLRTTVLDWRADFRERVKVVVVFVFLVATSSSWLKPRVLVPILSHFLRRREARRLWWRRGRRRSQVYPWKAEEYLRTTEAYVQKADLWDEWPD